jgi:hypothetical protein
VIGDCGMTITERLNIADRAESLTLTDKAIILSLPWRVTKMIRAKIWFRCAAMHDPVTPIMLQPAIIGWEAKNRRVGTQIERAFNGEELVRRMKGWITIEPNEVIEVVNQYGRLKLLDDRELVVEGEKIEDIQKLQKAIQETFGDEVDVEVIPKR